MKRRTFLKSMAATGVAASMTGTGVLTREAEARKKHDIGEIKSVKIDVHLGAK